MGARCAWVSDWSYICLTRGQDGLTGMYPLILICLKHLMGLEAILYQIPLLTPTAPPEVGSQVIALHIM